MIVYLNMTRRKTRNEKIKSEKSLEQKITYSYNQIIDKKDYSKDKTSDLSENVHTETYAEIKKIILVSGIIFAINIALFVLLNTNTVHIGFLGY